MTEKRRRFEGKTDYKARMEMLKSRRPRIVFRKTNKYIIGQYVKSKEAQDTVSIGLTSKELLEYGWPKEYSGSLKSLTASYFAGFILGKRIIEKEGKVKPVFDIGLIRNIPRSRAYAFLKGLVDSGLEMNTKKEIFPDEKRIKGSNLKNKIDFEKIKSAIEKL